MEKFALIVTEKPEAARRIAQALDYGGTPQKFEDRGVPYFLALRDRKLIVVPALGHLYTVVHQRGGRNYYPVFCFKWAPRHLVERNSKKIHTWIDVISKLADGADEFIDASDCDIEGSLIGYCVLKYACKDKENTAKRMRFSTLTKMELEAAYEERLPQLDFGLIEAGKTRHEIDWLYGINLSRALTLSSKGWSGKYATLSTGRVQGPTLKFLVDLEKEIQCFISKPYWSIKVEVELKGSIFKMEYERKTIIKRTEADVIVAACNRRSGEITNVDVRKFRQQPPFPFDLGTLQAEAYSLFRYTPRQTLNIAQHLYLNALISYPRTSSQKLPPAINYKAIIKALSEDHNFKDLTLELLKKKNLKPREGKKVDPAHPAVYPTGNLPKKQLSRQEKRIFDLVVRRFMAVFGDPAIKQSMKVSMEIN
ncbi:DNA topoisomerase I [Candidatus Bathyarchaeota archaeon]|nr:DNA topoisomerase I [Candidatus Bathyarchaeota archaeon]